MSLFVVHCTVGFCYCFVEAYRLAGSDTDYIHHANCSQPPLRPLHLHTGGSRLLSFCLAVLIFVLLCLPCHRLCYSQLPCHIILPIHSCLAACYNPIYSPLICLSFYRVCVAQSRPLHGPDVGCCRLLFYFKPTPMHKKPVLLSCFISCAAVGSSSFLSLRSSRSLRTSYLMAF